MVDEDGKEGHFKRYADDELPEFIGRIICFQSDPQIINKLLHLKQECIRALEAQKELEAKHTELKSWEGVPKDGKVTEMPTIAGHDENGKIIFGKDLVTEHADGTKEHKIVRPDGSIAAIIIDYLGGNSVCTKYDKNDNIIGKIIREKDNNVTKETYVDVNGNVIGILVNNGKEYTLQDENGNTVEPNTPKAVKIANFIAALHSN